MLPKHTLLHWPESKMAEDLVYGKRLVFGGAKLTKDLDLLASAGIEDVCFHWHPTKHPKQKHFGEAFVNTGVTFLLPDPACFRGMSPSEMTAGVRNFLMYATDPLVIPHVTLSFLPWNFFQVLDLEAKRMHCAEILGGGLAVIPIIQEYEDPENIALYEQFHMVGVSRDLVQNTNKFNRLVKRAQELGQGLIGISVNKPFQIEKNPFLAVVTDAWEVGMMFGDFYHFKNNKLTHYSQEEQEDFFKRHSKELKEARLNVSAAKHRNAHSVNLINLYAWQQYGDYLASLYQQNYTLDKNEQLEAKKLFLDSLPEEQRNLPMVREERQLMTRTPEGFCNTCVVSDTCPKFQKDATCWFDQQQPEIKSREDFLDSVTSVFALSANRIQKGILIERLEGNVLSKNLDKSLEVHFKNAKVLAEIMKNITPTKAEGSESDDDGEITLTAKGSSSFISKVMNRVQKKTQSPQGIMVSEDIVDAEVVGQPDLSPDDFE